MVDRKVFPDEILPPLEFAVGGDVFQAVGRPPGKVIQDAIHAAKKPPEEQLDDIIAFLDNVLLPDSAERYAERFRSTTRPISLEQAASHVMWLIEVYGQVPMVPPSSPLNGSVSEPAADTESSTAGQLPEVSTPTPSQRIGT